MALKEDTLFEQLWLQHLQPGCSLSCTISVPLALKRVQFLNFTAVHLFVSSEQTSSLMHLHAGPWVNINSVNTAPMGLHAPCGDATSSEQGSVPAHNQGPTDEQHVTPQRADMFLSLHFFSAQQKN